MLRIAICDDEPLFVEHLKLKIKKYMPDCEIVGFYSGIDLLRQNSPFDIYFLDIQMENVNGIETAKELRNKNEEAVIIFITAAKEYVFEAFDVAAMHYLVKPVDDNKLKAVLKRAEDKINKKQNVSDKKIIVKTNGRSITLNMSDVLFFENDIRKVTAHTTKGNICFYGTMTNMEKQAGDSFFRCHRGYLVNMAYISEYEADTIYLTNGERLYMSKERYSAFVKQYMSYLRRDCK